MSIHVSLPSYFTVFLQTWKTGALVAGLSEKNMAFCQCNKNRCASQFGIVCSTTLGWNPHIPEVNVRSQANAGIHVPKSGPWEFDNPNLGGLRFNKQQRAAQKLCSLTDQENNSN